MKTMEFCSGSMLHGFQGNPWNFPHAFSMVFPWFSHAFSTREVDTKPGYRHINTLDEYKKKFLVEGGRCDQIL